MAFRVASGTYTGDGTDNRNITVTPSFAIKFIIVKRTDSAGTIDGGAWGTLSSRSDSSFALSDNASGTASDHIQSLGTGTFQVGTADGVNKSATTYYYIVIGGDATEVFVGSYTGTGSSLGVTGVGFAPGMVMVIGDRSNGNNSRFGRWGTSSTDNEWWLNGQSVSSAGGQGIKSLDADGFTVGTRAEVNNSGDTYDYCCIKTVSGHAKSGTYTGTGSSLGVTGVGFLPEAVMVQNGDGANADRSSVNYYATAQPSNTTVNCAQAEATYSGGITSLDSDGFTLGTSAFVNRNTVAGYYMAFKDTPPTNTGNFFMAAAY